MDDRLRTGIVLVVVLVWAANMVAPILMEDYAASPELSVAFMAILGLLTAGYQEPPDAE